MTTKTVATRLLHARPPLDNRGNRGVWPAFFFSSLPCWRWGSPSPAKQQNHNKKTMLFGFRYVQRSLFSFPPSLFFFFCRWLIWSLLSSMAVEVAVEMGGGCSVSRERRNGACGWRGRPWVCGRRCWKGLLLTGWRRWQRE